MKVFLAPPGDPEPDFESDAITSIISRKAGSISVSIRIFSVFAMKPAKVTI